MIDRAFREAIRTVTVSYPIPFIVCAFLAFAIACFIGGLTTLGVLRWLLAGCGIVSLVTVLVVVGYSVFSRPDLLRSERYQVTTRVLDILGDNTLTADARNVSHRVAASFLGPNTFLTPPQDSGDSGDDGHG